MKKTTKKIYKFIAFIVVSFALGFYANVVIGNFLDDHSKVIPCDIANSQRIKKYRTMLLRTGDKRVYKEIWSRLLGCFHVYRQEKGS